MDTGSMEFFVLQNEKGQFFRRKGYGGSGDTWVDSLDTARVWAKIGGARSVSSYFYNAYPKYPPLKIVKLTVSAAEIIDDSARLEKARIKKIKAAEARKLQESKYRLEQAQKDLQRAQERYDKETKKK